MVLIVLVVCFYVLVNCIFIMSIFVVQGIFNSYLCRFAKDDVVHLAEALGLPVTYTGVQRTNATGLEALMVMLRRLTYPNRWCDLVLLFA